MPFQHRFWSVLAPFLEAKMAPKSIKNLSNFGFRAFLFRHRFLYRFWSIFGPNSTKNSFKFHWFYDILCKMGLPKLRSIFGAFLVPTWFHFASQNPPKTLQKLTPRGIKNLIDVCFDLFFRFLLHFEAKLGHVGLQKSARDAPNVAQDALKRQKAPKRRPDSQNDPNMNLQTLQHVPPPPPKWSSRPSKMTLQALQNDPPTPSEIESMRCQISFSLTRGGGNAACRAEDIYIYIYI